MSTVPTRNSTTKEKKISDSSRLLCRLRFQMSLKMWLRIESIPAFSNFSVNMKRLEAYLAPKG